MDSNLNPQLFDPGPAVPRKRGPRKPAQNNLYPSPHMRAEMPAYNPIAEWGADDAVVDHLDDITAADKFHGSPETWIPSYSIESPQDDYNPESVQHMVDNASGLDVPNVDVARINGRNILLDGNHRVNAALERGQMLVPSNLTDVDRWREDPW